MCKFFVLHIHTYVFIYLYYTRIYMYIDDINMHIDMHIYIHISTYEYVYLGVEGEEEANVGLVDHDRLHHTFGLHLLIVCQFQAVEILCKILVKNVLPNLFISFLE